MARWFKDIIEWTDDSSDTMVYRMPGMEKGIRMGSKLTVRPSQVAIFVNKGKIADVFAPGMYTLSTDNLPVITELLSLPYGFRSPFKTEVYFVNTKQFTAQKWGTTNPVMMKDREFGTIRLRGYGTYAFKVDDPVRFLNALFGTNGSFKVSDITQQLKSIIVTNISDLIAESKISAVELAANLNEFSENLERSIAPKLENMGLKISQVYVENLSLPEEVEKVIDERTKLGILSDSMGQYTQYQATQAMRDAAKNPGNNMASMGVGMGAGLTVGGFMGQNLNRAMDESNKPAENKTECPKCGAKIKASAKFCPECGEKIIAKGTKICSKCGASMKDSAKFCPECGEKMIKTCPKCGKEVKNSAKFCPECGEKL